jgi:peptidoglycan pentaglycine glycine transferase (the first glycine)
MESPTHRSGTLTPEQVTNPGRWNSALTSLPTAHVLQTWEWGAFKARHGWTATRYLWVEPDSDRPCAAASVLTRQPGRLSPAVMYVPKGPALNYGNTELLHSVLAHLEGIAQRKQALLIKVDPDVWADTIEGKVVMEVLRCQGWHASREQVQFRNTLLLDLTRSPDELLSAMKSKWRYNVRLATRKGVTVRQGTLADLPLLYDIYAETSARNGFVIRPREYYRDAWSEAIRAGIAHPLVAEVEGKPVAMLINFHFAGQAWYMYGGSRAVHRDKMPTHLLQWEAMRLAREQGCVVYDMWGAPDELDQSDPLWGVYRFKQGFGGEFVRHIGAWDFPASRFGYWLYAAVVPRLLAAMRWVYWRKSTAGRRRLAGGVESASP